jgi:hypothetical protein
MWQVWVVRTARSVPSGETESCLMSHAAGVLRFCVILSALPPYYCTHHRLTLHPFPPSSPCWLLSSYASCSKRRSAQRSSLPTATNTSVPLCATVLLAPVCPFCLRWKRSKPGCAWPSLERASQAGVRARTLDIIAILCDYRRILEDRIIQCFVCTMQIVVVIINHM